MLIKLFIFLFKKIEFEYTYFAYEQMLRFLANAKTLINYYCNVLLLAGYLSPLGYRMKKQIIAIFLLGFGLAGCFNAQESDSSELEEKPEVNIKTATQKFEKTNYYAEVKLEYPQISIDGNIENPLNDSISKWVTKVRLEFTDELLKEKQNAVDVYTKDYKIKKAENTQKFTALLDCEVAETPNYFSILVTFYNYGLGAHGNTYRKALVMSKQSQKLVSLGEVIDLATTGNQEKFNQLIKANLQVEDYCEIPKIKGNYKNFVVKNGELGIAFSDYDFGSYTCGSNTVYIKNLDLKNANLIKASPAHV